MGIRSFVLLPITDRLLKATELWFPYFYKERDKLDYPFELRFLSLSHCLILRKSYFMPLVGSPFSEVRKLLGARWKIPGLLWGYRRFPLTFSIFLNRIEPIFFLLTWKYILWKSPPPNPGNLEYWTYLDAAPSPTSPLLYPGIDVLFTLIIVLCVFIIYHNDAIIAYYRRPLSPTPTPSLIEVETRP